jgi:hypothetical protein
VVSSSADKSSVDSEHWNGEKGGAETISFAFYFFK